MRSEQLSRAPRRARRLLAAVVVALAAMLPAAPARGEGASGAAPLADQTRARVAVFEIRGEPGIRAAVRAAVDADARLRALDPALVDAAARGAGYDGSLNLTREEARRLGSTVGADALVLGMASIVDRGPEAGVEAGDAFLALFLVDGRSGALLRYRGIRAVGHGRAEALAAALAAARAEASGWADLVLASAVRRAEAPIDAGAAPEVLDLVSGTAETQGVIPPRFFKRPAPSFTEDAERARAVATVDLLVVFNADGTYGPIEALRWAGFGLDEAAISAVRACAFWPARRDGKPVAARALLRYNFKFRDR